MKSCLSLFYCFALLLLSVVCSPAPTVNFSSPPFSATDFNVDQPHNFIGLRGSSNTVPIGIYPIKITFLTGSNYFSIDATGIPNNFVLTASNNIATWQTNSSSSGGGGGGSNILYNFNTNDFTATLVTNISLSLNVPRTNRNNTFYGTQTFVDILANTLNTSAGAMVGTDLSWGGMGSGDGSGIVNLNATFLTSGTVGTARLGTGAANSGTYLRGDGSWQPVSGGGGGLPTLGGNGTNETFWGLTQLTNATSGNGISFDGTSFLLDGVNLNTGPGGTIGGIGSGLVALNGSGISSGTVDIAFLPSTVLTNLVPTNASVPSVSGHTGFVPTNSASGGGGGGFSNQLSGTVIPGFLRKYPLASTVSAGVAVAIGDLNKDGSQDFINTSSGDNVWVYTNSGSGTFARNNFSCSGGGNFNVALIDLLTNGFPGAIVSTASGGLLVFTNSGNGVFTYKNLSYQSIGSAQGNIAVADFNMDGRPDFVIQASAAFTGFSVMTNNGSGIFSQSQNGAVGIWASGASYGGIIAADFDNNGSPDLFVATQSGASPAVEIFTNNGSGQMSLQSSNILSALSLSTGAYTISDFNNDGFLDFMLASKTASVGAVFYTNNRAGGFGFFSSTPVSSASIGNGIFQRLPGLVYPAVYLPVNNTIVFMTNSGTAYSSVWTNSQTVTAGLTFGGMADFTGDGIPDMVVVGANINSTVFAGIQKVVAIVQGDGAVITNIFTLAENASASTLTAGSIDAAGVTTAGVLSIRTNFEPYTVAGDAIYNGNLATATNLASTNINFGLFPIQTNFISGQLYTNGYRRPVQVQANVGITTAAVTGDAGMALWIISGVGRGTTNYESISTTVAVSLAMSYTNQLGGFIPTNAIYTFTNISSGAGNSATLIGGQIY